MKQKNRKMKKRAQPFLSNKLKKMRKKIDVLDRKLLSLLDQRLHTACEIGKVKRKMGKKIYDPEREKEVIERLKIRNRGPLREKDLEKIFRTIIKVCRRSQKVVSSKVPL